MAMDNGGAIGSGGGGAGGSNGEHDLSDSLKTFGAVLKALREEARLTQEEFAQRVQYSTAYVAKIEQGKRFPPSDLPSRAEPALGAAAAKVLGAAARSLTRRAGAGVVVPAVGGDRGGGGVALCVRVPCDSWAVAA